MYKISLKMELIQISAAALYNKISTCTIIQKYPLQVKSTKMAALTTAHDI